LKSIFAKTTKSNFQTCTMAAEPLSFTISLQPNAENDDPSNLPIVPQHARESFSEDGFVVVENVLSKEHVDALNDRLEDILRGTYDRGKAPDKTPRLLKLSKAQSSCSDKCGNLNKTTATEPSGTKKIKKNLSPAAGPLGFSGNLQNVKVLQVINVHKADAVFRQFACSMALGKVVAELAGWEDGARLAQDQVWAKPPGAPPLVFHRDAPYFMFEPACVVTVWLALDDMDAELGPLEYVRGSHKWGHGRVGTANQFFQNDFFQSNGLLESAAAKEGIVKDLDIVSMAGLRAGGLSIHDGLTWHGSGRNQSRKRPRRGLGLHFVPASVHFTDQAIHSSLWKPYVMDAEDPAAVELPAEDFPISWQP
jgi:ectoine hydroxylase-related dioxygenase (phytanoyl-CoA dioxygenase family)